MSCLRPTTTKKVKKSNQKQNTKRKYWKNRREQNWMRLKCVWNHGNEKSDNTSVWTSYSESDCDAFKWNKTKKKMSKSKPYIHMKNTKIAITNAI